MEFYRCRHCGNLITFMDNKGPAIVCCGEKMEKLIPGTVDAALEKHSPVIKQEGNMVRVEVGSVAHPMLPEHYIQWIVLETKNGVQIKKLSPSDEPCALFPLAEGDAVVAAWEYCNIHGLWKKDNA